MKVFTHESIHWWSRLGDLWICWLIKVFTDESVQATDESVHSWRCSLMKVLTDDCPHRFCTSWRTPSRAREISPRSVTRGNFSLFILLCSALTFVRFLSRPFGNFGSSYLIESIDKFPDPWPWINNCLEQWYEREFSACMSNTSVQLVWRDCVKQLDTTPLNSFRQVAELRMVMHHHGSECHAGRLAWCLQVQGHSEGSYNQIWLYLLYLLNCWSLCNQI